MNEKQKQEMIKAAKKVNEICEQTLDCKPCPFYRKPEGHEYCCRLRTYNDIFPDEWKYFIFN